MIFNRTAVVTAASIVGVLAAGGSAIGANIGILSAAQDQPVGELSAFQPGVSTALTTVAAAPITGPPITASTDGSGRQRYEVEDAGTVAVELVAGAVRVQEVVPSEGWTADASEPGTTGALVVFTKGDVTYEFHAEAAGQAIAARVDRPETQLFQVPAPVTTSPPAVQATIAPQVTSSPSSPSSGTNDDDGEEYHEADHHEGRDDDD